MLQHLGPVPSPCYLCPDIKKQNPLKRQKPMRKHWGKGTEQKNHQYPKAYRQPERNNNIWVWLPPQCASSSLIPWPQIINSPRRGICHFVCCLLLRLQILPGVWTTVDIKTSADQWMNKWLVISSWVAAVVKSSLCESGKLPVKSWNDPHVDLN